MRRYSIFAVLSLLSSGCLFQALDTRSESETKTYYYRNGQMAAEGLQLLEPSFSNCFPNCRPWQNEIRVGEWHYWHPNGQLRAVVNYEVDVYTQCCFGGYCEMKHEFKSGFFAFWHPNGQLVTEGEFVVSIRHIETNCEGGDSVKTHNLPADIAVFDDSGEVISDSVVVATSHDKIFDW